MKEESNKSTGMRSLLAAIGGVCTSAFITLSAEAGLVMDSNMNRFDPNPSKFASPSFQRECGFNAVAIQPGMPLAVTALFDGYDRRVFPEGSEARAWVLEARKNFAAKFREAKDAGLKVLATTDIIVLPHRMKELYHDEICGEDGRIDFMKPKTQEIYRALLAELFDAFHQLALLTPKAFLRGKSATTPCRLSPRRATGFRHVLFSSFGSYFTNSSRAPSTAAQRPHSDRSVIAASAISAERSRHIA